jgi:RNA polymerase sigma-70 factor, ECF subfamily
MEIISRMREASPLEETSILEKARLNPMDFAPIYERYFLRIYRYCLRRTGQAEEAEDLTSLIFTRALHGLNTYHGGTVAAWLFQIARNATINHLQKKGRHSLPLTEETGLPGQSGEDTLERLINLESQQHLARLVATLPEDQRDLLDLRFAGSLSAKEIGTILGKSEGAVRVGLHRIIQRLRTSYQQSIQE